MKIRFGTDGWRGIIADTYTFENVKIIGQALADYLHEIGTADKGIAVGYDHRFMSEKYAELMAQVAAANGIKVILGNQAVPTPALSFAVKHFQCAGGIMITASHNPPEYNGVKFKGDYGGSAIPEITQEIEKHLYKFSPKTAGSAIKKKIETTDLIKPYLTQLRSLVDLDKISKKKFRVVHDAMYGSGKNHLAKLLEDTDCEVISIRSNRDCLFGGILPEPIPKNLELFSKTVREQKADLGIATDGDADRFGVVESNGQYIWPHYTIPLLYEHLTKNRGWTGNAVRTVSLASIIDEVVKETPGAKVFEVPVGFKNICELMLKEDIVIGGEESGGIGVKNHIPERDGLLIGLLMLEYLATSGKTLQELVADLEKRFGILCYDRIDAHLGDDKRIGLIQRLKTSPPDKLGDIAVDHIETLDGIKFFLKDKGWILIRASDTEPVVRLYSGSDTMEKVQKTLQAGKALSGIEG